MTDLQIVLGQINNFYHKVTPKKLGKLSYFGSQPVIRLVRLLFILFPKGPSEPENDVQIERVRNRFSFTFWVQGYNNREMIITIEQLGNFWDNATDRAPRIL